MGFIDRNETHLHVAELGLEELAAQSLGRDIEQFSASHDAVLQNRKNLVVLHTAIDGSGNDTPLAQVVHLVLHECYQRSDNDADTLHRQGRNLEGDRLSATGRHQSQRVVTSTDGLDDLPLNTTEVIVAPIFLQKRLIIEN